MNRPRLPIDNAQWTAMSWYVNHHIGCSAGDFSPQCFVKPRIVEQNIFQATLHDL